MQSARLLHATLCLPSRGAGRARPWLSIVLVLSVLCGWSASPINAALCMQAFSEDEESGEGPLADMTDDAVAGVEVQRSCASPRRQFSPFPSRSVPGLTSRVGGLRALASRGQRTDRPDAPVPLRC